MLCSSPAPPPGADYIALARAGSSEALGAALADCRNYLLLVANAAIGDGLKAKVGASDVVQETFIEAQRIFHRFEGNSQEELLRWLAKILEFKLGTVVKFYTQTAKRDPAREQAPALFDSSIFNPQMLADRGESPSAVIAARDEAHRLRDALTRLPEHYRQVIDLRIRQQLSFEDIGLRIGRTAEASRRLLARAILQLQAAMPGSQ